MGAGKSTVAGILARNGAVIVDSDAVAREVVEPGTSGLAALVEAFGADILRPDGSLDRPALAAKAFADDASRTTLNGITHPLVGARTQQLVEAAPDDAVVVQDIPLLVENGVAPLFHLTFAVMADVETRMWRLVEQRGVDEADARARIATQATDEQRRAAVDVLIDNSGPADAVDAQVDTLWQRLATFESNLRARRRIGAQYRLVEPDPEWPAKGRRLVDRLHAVCGADAARIDHIGSTAVPGLPAKDVLDVQITVRDLGVADALRDRLEDAGFPHIAHLTDDPHPTSGDPDGTDAELWTKRVHGSADPGRIAHIHLRAADSPGQRWALVFRDWLRADPAVREEYLAVKRAAEAAAAGLSGHEAATAYLAVKKPWFDQAYLRGAAVAGIVIA
jgi:dephospho-CoA kinase